MTSPAIPRPPPPIAIGPPPKPPPMPRRSSTWVGSSLAPGRNRIRPAPYSVARSYDTNERLLCSISTMSMNKTNKRTLLAGLVLALALAGGASAATRDTTLSLVGYSTPKSVMGKIIQAWQKTPAGGGVNVNQSYGASTDQARAVANGLKADVVFLSTGDDVNLLVDAGLVDSKWNRQGYAGIGADTVVVFAVRNGNPKHIRSWDDLV